MPESSERGALTEAVFYILLALYEPMHGYGVMQRVKELSGGRVALGAGTLYGAVVTMTEKGWIRPLPGEKDSRKKQYVVTDAGKAVAREEVGRLEELAENGRRITGKADEPTMGRTRG
jgi:DNA-binding PadR family transcriptional regulator